MVPEFLNNKGNHVEFMITFVAMNINPLHHGVSLHPLLLSFHLQIAYRKLRNLQIGVDKLVGKVLINLLHHTKSAPCIISIILINVPAVA